MIKYYLTPITLEGSTQFYRAVVVSNGTIGEDQIVEEIAKRNTGLPLPSIASIIKTLYTIRDEKLRDGYQVQIGDTLYRASIKGSYETENEQADTGRVTVSLSDSKRPLRDANYSRITQRIDTSLPLLEGFTNIKTNTVNTNVSLGNMGRLTGSNLAFDPADATQGIFFVEEGAGTEVKVEFVGENRPAQLMFMIPALTANKNYVLEVRNKVREGAELKVGRLAEVLKAIS